VDQESAVYISDRVLFGHIAPTSLAITNLNVYPGLTEIGARTKENQTKLNVISLTLTVL
jgi:hypothetical protein